MLVCGGAKVEDKLGVLRHLGGRADTVLVGGKMAEQFRIANPLEFPVELPVDVVAAARFEADAESRICSTGELPYAGSGSTSGPRRDRASPRSWEREDNLLNGPMGVFEWPQFTAGTQAVAEAIAQRMPIRSSAEPTPCERSMSSN